MAVLNRKPKTAADKALIEDRRSRVAANLKAGLTLREIAKAVGASLGTVQKDVKVIMRRWQEDQITDIHQRVMLQLRRTDAFINAIYKKAAEGDLSRQERVQRWMEMQDRYIGIGQQGLKIGGPNNEQIEAGGVFVLIPDNGRGEAGDGTQYAVGETPPQTSDGNPSPPDQEPQPSE